MISEIFGNVLDGDVVGEKGLNKGAVLKLAFHAPAVPRSNCSHEKVMVSLIFASELAPVKTKGVEIGIV